MEVGSYKGMSRRCVREIHVIADSLSRLCESRPIVFIIYIARSRQQEGCPAWDY